MGPSRSRGRCEERHPGHKGFPCPARHQEQQRQGVCATHSPGTSTQKLQGSPEQPRPCPREMIGNDSSSQTWLGRTAPSFLACPFHNRQEKRNLKKKKKCFRFLRVSLPTNDLSGLVTQLQDIFIDFCISWKGTGLEGGWDGSSWNVEKVLIPDPLAPASSPWELTLPLISLSLSRLHTRQLHTGAAQALAGVGEVLSYPLPSCLLTEQTWKRLAIALLKQSKTPAVCSLYCLSKMGRTNPCEEIYILQTSARSKPLKEVEQKPGHIQLCWLCHPLVMLGCLPVFNHRCSSLHLCRDPAQGSIP